jgi:hypothetical protein
MALIAVLPFTELTVEGVSLRRSINELQLTVTSFKYSVSHKTVNFTGMLLQNSGKIGLKQNLFFGIVFQLKSIAEIK